MIENLDLSGISAIRSVGKGGSNFIQSNDAANVVQSPAGDDSLYGHGGGDTLVGSVGLDYLDGGDGADSLDGGTGADAMWGGAGSDIYYVGATTDSVVETLAVTAGGVDTVYTTSTFSLGAKIEALALVGATAANGTGNGANNDLYGNGLVNTLRGLGGADTFRSGNGADVLIGGRGNDLFRYLTVTGSAPASRDIIRAGDGEIAFRLPGETLADRFDFSQVDANAGRAGVQDFTFGTAIGTGRLWAVNSGSNTLIRDNTDADAAADLEITVEDGAVLGLRPHGGRLPGVT